MCKSNIMIIEFIYNTGLNNFETITSISIMSDNPQYRDQPIMLIIILSSRPNVLTPEQLRPNDFASKWPRSFVPVRLCYASSHHRSLLWRFSCAPSTITEVWVWCLVGEIIITYNFVFCLCLYYIYVLLLNIVLINLYLYYFGVTYIY